MNRLKNLMLEQGYWMHLNNHKVLILSGGQGKRFGIPKALAIFNGETFLDTILSKCLSLDLDTYVVINPQVDKLLPQNRSFTTILGDSNKDMYDSIMKGIHHIKDFSKLIIWPVDHPFVSIDSVKSLLESNSEDKFIVPSFSGRLGHPIVFPNSAIAYLQQCKSLKELTQQIGRVIVEVNDSGILHNINKKEDLP